MTNDKKRYRLSISYYIYANDKENAFEMANDIVEKENEDYDNHPQIESLHESPWGKFRIFDITSECKRYLRDKIANMF